MTSSEKQNSKPARTTHIIINEKIDTPYPYSPLSLSRQSRNSALTVEKAVISKDPSSEEAPLQQRIRSILSVTTWDGRLLMDLSTGD